MSKSSNLNVRINPDTKQQAEEILDTLGVSPSAAITMFYKQISLQGGLPFEIKVPQRKILDMSKLTNEELQSELELGIQDMREGRTTSATEVFAKLREEYK